jgi:hypothetical protein
MNRLLSEAFAPSKQQSKRARQQNTDLRRWNNKQGCWWGLIKYHQNKPRLFRLAWCVDGGVLVS